MVEYLIALLRSSSDQGDKKRMKFTPGEFILFLFKSIDCYLTVVA